MPYPSKGKNGTPTPPVGTLADDEMLKANAGGAEIVGTGDTNSDTEVNYGSKNIVTTGTVESGTGTFKLGGAIAISSAGENKTTTNLVSGQHFNPVWIDQSDNEPKARMTVGVEQETIQEPSKADILINPTWPSNPTTDWRVVKLTMEVDTTITNVLFSVTKGGEAFYSARIGTLTANTETQIDLSNTPNNVPAEAFFGDTYEATLWSEDGDVRAKGSIANALPFFKIGFFEFVDDPVISNSVETTALMKFVVDEDDMASNSPTKVPTQQSVKHYVDESVTANLQYKGGYDSSTNTPNLENAPTGVITGWFYTVTVAGTFFTTPVQIGDALIAETDDPTVESDWTILNRNLDAATVKALYESNPDTNAFTDAAESKLSGVESGANVGVTATQHRNTHGYDIHVDDTTKAFAYTALDGVKTAIQNNAATEIHDLPASIPHLIGPSGGAILDQVNAIYSVGIQMSATPDVRDKDYYLLFEIPDGISPGVDMQISKRFQRFAKKLKDEVISMSFVLPCTPSIVNKEIIAYIEAEDTDVEYWATQLTVAKISGPIS